MKQSSQDLTDKVESVFTDLSKNLEAITMLQPTLESLATGIVLQKETLQKIESQNSQRQSSKSNSGNNKGKKVNTSITKSLFGFNGVGNEG